MSDNGNRTTIPGKGNDVEHVKGTAKAEQKSGRVQVKSTDDETGRFRAVVSVFGNTDAYGDVMVPGAFSKSLEQYKADGDLIPFLWDHATGDPFAYVGAIDEAKETDEGLEVSGVFDLDNPTAAQVYKLVKGRRVKEWSFGFIVPPEGYAITEKDGTTVRELREVELLEVSTTLVGANRSTRTVEVRSAPDGGAPTVTPAADPEAKATAQAESDTGAVPAVSAETLDAALDALDAARGTIDAALETIKAARATLEAGDGDGANEPGKSGHEERENAAASVGTADDEGQGAKSSASDDAAAANVRALETRLAIFNLERNLKP